MADAPSLKSSKKNRKRRKPGKASEPIGLHQTKGPDLAVEVVKKAVDPLTSIKQQLEEAKLAKDHDRAQELRQQLWKLQDSSSAEAPVSTTSEATLLTATIVTREPSTVTADPTEKSLAKLKKKLRMIQLLKERAEKGDQLEANQLAKIKTESEIVEEIEILEELLQASQLR